MQRPAALEFHAADAPAAQDRVLLIAGDARHGRIDQPQQTRVGVMHGKRKGMAFKAGEILEVHVVQVVFVDQVIGTDRVPQIQVGLTKRHGADGAEG